MSKGVHETSNFVPEFRPKFWSKARCIINALSDIKLSWFLIGALIPSLEVNDWTNPPGVQHLEYLTSMGFQHATSDKHLGLVFFHVRWITNRYIWGTQTLYNKYLSRLFWTRFARGCLVISPFREFIYGKYPRKTSKEPQQASKQRENNTGKRPKA